jgi:hypothetical protein
MKSNMIEVALFTGLGLLGYILATKYAPPQKESFIASPRPVIQSNDNVQITQDAKGHNNMVPFFGGRVTQNVDLHANEGVLDSHAGSGTHHFQKREVQSLYDVTPGVGDPFGNPNESDFVQSRMVSGMRMNNVFPVEKVNVGPGLNDGYTNVPSGGYQQFNALRDFALPKTTDEIRAANKPKLSYEKPMIPGAHYITQPGLQAPVNKNRPDTFHLLTDDQGNLMYVNTTTGAQIAPAQFAEIMMKQQERETTSREYFGEAQAASGGFWSYIRAFTEPFEQFMKLTVGDYFGSGGGGTGWAQSTYVVDQYLAAYTNAGREASVNTDYKGPSGPSGVASLPAGPQSYNVMVKRDETLLEKNYTDPAASHIASPATAEQQGSMRYQEPLNQGIEIDRMHPDLLTAFRSNPYTQSLQSTY